MGRDGMGWRREGGGRGGVGRGRREWYEDKGTVWRRVVFRVHMEREEGKGWNQRKEGTAPEGGRDGTRVGPTNTFGQFAGGGEEGIGVQDV